MRIINEIGMPAYLEQLAEECTELAQAALKYSRLLRGENPTTKTEEGCVENLAEELADVIVCTEELTSVLSDRVERYVEFKKERWQRHLEERKNGRETESH